MVSFFFVSLYCQYIQQKQTPKLQGGPDSIRQFLIINNQSIQQQTGKWESTFCCR
jgi:hypothetical protein